jgi:hypothetical protein
MMVPIGHLFLDSWLTVLMPLIINIMAITIAMRIITEMICSIT